MERVMRRWEWYLCDFLAGVLAIDVMYLAAVLIPQMDLLLYWGTVQLAVITGILGCALYEKDDGTHTYEPSFPHRFRMTVGQVYTALSIYGFSVGEVVSSIGIHFEQSNFQTCIGAIGICTVASMMMLTAWITLFQDHYEAFARERYGARGWRGWL